LEYPVMRTLSLAILFETRLTARKLKPDREDK
jgi:hypothetical protein